MLPGGYSSVLQAKDRDEFRAEVVRFTQQLGFDTVAAVTVVERGIAGTEFISVDNTPLAFSDTFENSTKWQPRPGDATLPQAKRADHLGSEHLHAAGSG